MPQFRTDYVTAVRGTSGTAAVEIEIELAQQAVRAQCDTARFAAGNAIAMVGIADGGQTSCARSPSYGQAVFWSLDSTVDDSGSLRR